MDGQLCYKADVESLLEDNKTKVVDKKKMVTEGLVFWLDYNENRMVEEVGEQSSDLGIKDKYENVIMYIGTIGKNKGLF